MCRCLVCLFGAAALVLLQAMAPVMAAPALIFFPPDSLRHGNQAPLVPDYPQLFSEPNAWASAWSKLSGFSMNNYLADLGPEDLLHQAFAFLTAHHISLEVALQSLPVENCGAGVEGLVQSVLHPINTAQRMKRLGAPVETFALDEPLTFGHFYDGHNACQLPVEEVAQRLATTISAVRAVYPNVRINENEVPTGTVFAHWKTVLPQWLEAYQRHTGTPLDAMTLDVDWRDPHWQDAVRQSVTILHAHGVKAGLYLDATGGPKVTDQSWMAEAHRNGETIIREKFGLDFVVIASWMGHPLRLLPASDPLSLTSLIPWFAGKL